MLGAYYHIDLTNRNSDTGMMITPIIRIVVPFICILGFWTSSVAIKEYWTFFLLSYIESWCWASNYWVPHGIGLACFLPVVPAFNSFDTFSLDEFIACVRSYTPSKFPIVPSNNAGIASCENAEQRSDPSSTHGPPDILTISRRSRDALWVCIRHLCCYGRTLVHSINAFEEEILWI